MSSPASEPAGELPLANRRVVVTRSPAQSGELCAALVLAGADVVELAVIDIDESPDNAGTLGRGLNDVDAYDWLVVTSINGAQCVSRHGSMRPRRCRLAAIGRATAAVLNSYGPVSFVPSVATSDGFLAEFCSAFPAPAGGRVLLVQGDLAPMTIAEQLRRSGWIVDRLIAYRTLEIVPEQALLDRARSADAITFMSGSAVRAFIRAAGVGSLPPVVASIGPSTTAALGEFGVTGIVQATTPSVAALAKAVSNALQ
jgi:uroporphyrinogen-III synthase